MYFHKEASYEIFVKHNRTDVSYWFVRKNDKIATIKAYGTQNPITSSYELLWKELQDNNDASLVAIQNMMRRIIEYYFRLLGGFNDNDLIIKFENYEDKMIAKSLISWLNDGSHNIPDDIFIDSYSDTV